MSLTHFCKTRSDTATDPRDFVRLTAVIPCTRLTSRTRLPLWPPGPPPSPWNPPYPAFILDSCPVQGVWPLRKGGGRQWQRSQEDDGPEARLHQGGLCCWSWPWFFLYIFNRKWRDSDTGHFFLGCSLSWRHLTAAAQRTWLCLALWADSQPRPGLLAPQSWTLGKECRGANCFRICRKIG